MSRALTDEQRARLDFYVSHRTGNERSRTRHLGLCGRVDKSGMSVLGDWGEIHPAFRCAACDWVLVGSVAASEGAERIAAERLRQVEAKGYTAEHDEENDRCQLAFAAACYAASSVNGQNACDRNGNDLWPWAREWDKRPSPGPSVAARIRAMEKAGALCAAEIDRLLRAQEQEATTT